MPKSMKRSTITNNVWYKNMLVGNDAFSPGAFELISTQVLTSSASSVTFNSIPQDYKHLQLRIVSRVDVSAGTSIRYRMNGVTSSSYNFHTLTAEGSSVSSNTSGPVTEIFASNFFGMTASSFGAFITEILDYSSTSKTSVLRHIGGHMDSSRSIGLTTGFLDSTTALTSIEVREPSFGFATNSRFSLYGIRG